MLLLRRRPNTLSESMALCRKMSTIFVAFQVCWLEQQTQNIISSYHQTFTASHQHSCTPRMFHVSMDSMREYPSATLNKPSTSSIISSPMQTEKNCHSHIHTLTNCSHNAQMQTVSNSNVSLKKLSCIANILFHITSHLLCLGFRRTSHKQPIPCP